MTTNKNIFLFYTYRIFSRLYFHVAVLFIYFYTNKLSIMNIEILLAIYGITLMLGSHWKNKIFLNVSEKYIISIGELIKAIGLFLFTIQSHIVVFIIAQVLSGIGYSLTAGTDSRLLKKILPNNDSDTYKSIESSSNSYMFLSFLIAGITGSILFELNPHLVFYGSICSNIICLITIWNLKVNKQSSQDNKSNLQIDKQIINQFEKFWINYYAVSRAFPLAIFVGFLPYFLFVTVNINLYYFGIVLSLFTLSGSLSARFLVRIYKKVGYKQVLLITVLLTLFSMILLSIVTDLLLSIVVVALLGFASGGVRPLTVSNLTTENSNKEKQSYLFASMEKLYGFWNATLLVIGGILFNYLGFNGIMVLFTILYGSLILVYYKKFNFKVDTKSLRNLDI